MLKYTIRRFVVMLFTLFVIATGTFFLLAAVPGDALTARADRLPEKVRENLYKRYGLDKPLLERYTITMKGMLHGDFGESVIYEGETVSDIIREKGPVSARLGLQQMILGVGLGLLLGVIAATRKGTWADYAIVFFSILLISVPHLVFGILLQRVFAGELHWFPTIGWPKGDLKTLWFGGWKYTILPTLTGCFSLHAGRYESGIYSDGGIQRTFKRGYHPETCAAQLLYSGYYAAADERGDVYHRLLLY